MNLDYSTEKQKRAEGYAYIIGVDEVGRGPWAGPVVAAAVILDAKKLPLDATDSKKLTAKKRAVIDVEIRAHARYCIAEASVEEVDAMNIRNATFLAMYRAVVGLGLSADELKSSYVFIDGNAIPADILQLGLMAEAVIKGDFKVLSIAAASIIAKEFRDKMMAELACLHPHYGWEKNAGYGTKMHQIGLASHGVTVHHRKSFKPIQALL